MLRMAAFLLAALIRYCIVAHISNASNRTGVELTTFVQYCPITPYHSCDRRRLLGIQPRQQPTHLVGCLDVMGTGNKEVFEVFTIPSFGKNGGDLDKVFGSVCQDEFCGPDRLLAKTYL